MDNIFPQENGKIIKIGGVSLINPDITFSSVKSIISQVCACSQATFSFTDQGSIVEVFTGISVWAGIRKAIERVNANATVA